MTIWFLSKFFNTFSDGDIMNVEIYTELLYEQCITHNNIIRNSSIGVMQNG